MPSYPHLRPAPTPLSTATWLLQWLSTRAQAAAPVAAPSVQAPVSDAETAIAALRRKVEENSEYVGLNFVTEARAIHDGDAPERAIYGEARFEDAKKLIEDGVPVAPLPFLPVRKMN